MTVPQRILERAAALSVDRDLAQEWIATPSEALGGCRPSDLLGTPDGREAVENVLGRLIVGTYA